MKKIWGLSFVLLTVSFSYGCASDATIACDKAAECSVLGAGVTADTCVSLIEDRLESGMIREEDLEACSKCADTQTCPTITSGGCNAACAGVI